METLTKTKKTTNLFSKAKENSIPNKKASEREIVEVKGIEKTLERMAEIDEQMTALKAERGVLDTDIKEIGKEEMLGLYDKSSIFPGTIVIKSGEMEYQFITMDKYITIDKDRADELTEKYTDTIVNEDTTYSFNNALLEKYAQVISDLINKSTKIEKEDKEALIESSVKYSIAKGMIKNLRNLEFFKFDLKEIVENIRPILAIKSIKKS